MKALIPQGLSGKALTQFLVKNKEQIIKQKREFFRKSDPFTMNPEFLGVTGSTSIKSGDESPSRDPGQGILRVKVVGNTAWWCDSQMDVLTDTCWDKSISERIPPHIKNHAWDDCTSHVGDVVSVYSQVRKLRDLGLQKNGSTTCLVWETDIREEYDPRVYLFYKNQKINQHSIGLRYINLELAVNDRGSEKEFDFWNKYFDKIINKDMVRDAGYFWLVKEIQVIENSCVFLGANELTPTLETSVEKGIVTDQPPGGPTGDQPKKTKFNFGLIKQ